MKNGLNKSKIKGQIYGYNVVVDDGIEELRLPSEIIKVLSKQEGGDKKMAEGEEEQPAKQPAEEPKPEETPSEEPTGEGETPSEDKPEEETPKEE